MFGFVYIWYDKKHKRYYIGSHKGHENDGYICSSSWMKRAYERRPHDFKRRIISRVNTNRNDLLNEEQKYLDLIEEHELGKKYYNLKKNAYGGYTKEAQRASIEAQRNRPDHVKKLHNKKLSEALKNKPWSESRRKAQVGNYTQRMRIEYCGVILGTIQDAQRITGKSRATIDRWCGNKSKSEWRKIYVSELGA